MPEVEAQPRQQAEDGEGQLIPGIPKQGCQALVGPPLPLGSCHDAAAGHKGGRRRSGARLRLCCDLCQLDHHLHSSPHTAWSASDSISFQFNLFQKAALSASDSIPVQFNLFQNSALFASDSIPSKFNLFQSASLSASDSIPFPIGFFWVKIHFVYISQCPCPVAACGLTCQLVMHRMRECVCDVLCHA